MHQLVIALEGMQQAVVGWKDHGLSYAEGGKRFHSATYFRCMEKERVLVTGGAGYIGSHTVVELSRAGFEPVILDNFINSHSSAVDGMQRILGYRPTVVEMDCGDASALEHVFESATGGGRTVAGVIHFAAFKAVGESTQHPLKYYRNNLGSTVALLEAMAAFGIPNLVFSSSCTVYGQPTSIPVDEQAPMLEAESPYGYTKQACERIIRDTHASGQSLNTALLRYFNPIGAHPSSEIGELPLGHPNNLIPYLTQATAGLRDPLTVFGDDYPTPDGTCIRDYIHVVDLACAHVSALRWLMNQQNACEIFNLGTGQGHSVLDVIHTFERANGIAVPHQIGPRRPGDVTAIFADAGKAEAMLGWKCERSLEEALRDAWNWERKLASR